MEIHPHTKPSQVVMQCITCQDVYDYSHQTRPGRARDRVVWTVHSCYSPRVKVLIDGMHYGLPGICLCCGPHHDHRSVTDQFSSYKYTSLLLYNNILFTPENNK